MAAQLGANTRQKQPVSRPSNPASSSDELQRSNSAMKSDVASTCSTITCTSDKKMPSRKYESIGSKQPPDAVLVSHSQSTTLAEAGDDAPLCLLSEYSEGSRHGLLVFHKNNSPRKVTEVVIEDGNNWVECSVNGELKKYRPSHLVVVPSNQGLNVGDVVPSNYGCKSPIAASKKLRTKPIEQKPSSLPVDQLFSWCCHACDSENRMLDFICHSCKSKKTSKSKLSTLLEIAEVSLTNAETIEEAVANIPYAARPSIPEKVISHLLEAREKGAFADLSLPRNHMISYERLYYWMCGSCTMQNSYKRTTCSACLQEKVGLAERSPLLKIAEEAATNSQTTSEALLLVPEKQRRFVPEKVMDVLVTCVFIIEGRHGQKRRCRKQKKEGYDYCTAHFNPGITTRDDSTCSPIDSLSKASQCEKSDKPSSRGIPAINDIMPSFLRDIKQKQVNDRKWTIYSIEDSVVCGEHSAFPLGMKVRIFSCPISTLAPFH